MEAAEGSGAVKDWGFLNDSNISDAFGGKGSAKGSVKDLSRELSEIFAGHVEESEQNQLDQGIVEDEEEDKDEQIDNLENMLQSVLDDGRIDDELGQVQRFTKPILSLSSDSEELKDLPPTRPHEKAASSTQAEDTRGKVSTSTASLAVRHRPESTGEVVIEGEEPRTTGSFCGSCASTDVKGLAQAFCSLF